MSEQKQAVDGIKITGVDADDIHDSQIEINQTIKGDVVGPTTNIYQVQPLPNSEVRARADLNVLLKNVETSWIKGVLEKSVYHAVMLDLGKEVRAETVENPWETVVGRAGQADQPLPAGTRISAIFEEMPLLLILGEPGSGKTVTLLELARDLIAKVRADATFAQPIPVVLNLSTWTNKHQSLHDWLIEELRSKYYTTRQLGQTWLEQRRILPLLDGLDEVKRENRPACVEAINQFAVDYGLQGLVVCSRLNDYLELPVRLKFYGAIYLRPLDERQIDQYLTRGGSKLEGLRCLLQEDESLRTLAQSPLMLNIMSLAYQGRSVEELTGQAPQTLEARRKELFDTYIQQMFERKGTDREYPEEQTKKWLSRLAQNMRQHHQPLFLIEGLQPSCLQSRDWRRTYILTSRLIAGLIFGLSGGLSLGGQRTGLLIGLIFGLIFGLSLGFIDMVRFEWLDKHKERRNPSPFLWLAIHVIAVWLIFGLTIGLIVRLNIGLNIDPIDGIIAGVVVGLIVGLRIRGRDFTNDIQTTEALQWSWRKALQGGLIGGVVAALGGALFIKLSGGQSEALSDGLVVGLVVGVMSAVFNGLSRRITATKTSPNQGIHLSARNALFGGLIIWLSVTLGDGVNDGLRDGLSDGLFVGLIGSLWYGGLDVVQHYTLRLILFLQDHTPFNYARFLDYAVEHIFLQKVGGGYHFIHRLLLEHFAAMRQAGAQR